jgi:hypothetical protein
MVQAFLFTGDCISSISFFILGWSERGGGGASSEQKKEENLHVNDDFICCENIHKYMYLVYEKKA